MRISDGDDGSAGGKVVKLRKESSSASASAHVPVAADRNGQGNGRARWQALACNY